MIDWGVDSTLPGYLPWTESYLKSCARVSAFVRSLIATTSIPFSSSALLKTNLPILPKPLIAIFVIYCTSLIDVCGLVQVFKYFCS